MRHIEDEGRRYMTVKLISYTLGFVGFILIGVIWITNITGLFAYIGIMSVGLAIALQDLLTNLAGWLFIIIRQPFRVGDRIEIGDSAGDVIDIRLFQFSIIEIGNWVHADQSTGRIIHIPNGWVFKKALANFTVGFHFLWNEIEVMVTFESNWEKAKGILFDIAKKFTAIQSAEAANEIRKAADKYLIHFKHLTPIVWTRVDESGVTLTIRYLCAPRQRRSTSSNIWEEILRSFKACDDVDFAYPTMRYYDNTVEGKPGAGGKPGG